MSECEKCKGATRHYGDSALCYDHQRERITALESERDGWRDHANKLAADKIALESANDEADKILGDGIDELHAQLTALESAAQAMVAWSVDNFDIDHCEPFDDLRAALLGVQT